LCRGLSKRENEKAESLPRSAQHAQKEIPFLLVKAIKEKEGRRKERERKVITKL